MLGVSWCADIKKLGCFELVQTNINYSAFMLERLLYFQVSNMYYLGFLQSLLHSLPCALLLIVMSYMSQSQSINYTKTIIISTINSLTLKDTTINR